jgi:hypothetical protein
MTIADELFRLAAARRLRYRPEADVLRRMAAALERAARAEMSPAELEQIGMRRGDPCAPKRSFWNRQR